MVSNLTVHFCVLLGVLVELNGTRGVKGTGRV